MGAVLTLDGGSVLLGQWWMFVGLSFEKHA